jgi:hypothetical protein
MILTGENRSSVTENCPSFTFSTTNLTWPGLGSNSPRDLWCTKWTSPNLSGKSLIVSFLEQVRIMSPHN